MTLTLDPKILASVHAALKSIPDRKNVIPVAGMYHFEAAESGMAVTATDCDIEATMSLDVEASFDPVCLPPFLIEAAGGLKAATVDFAIDERQAVATAGKARFAGAVLPGTDFPRLQHTFVDRTEIAGDALAAIIAATVDAGCVPGEDHRYYLEGVFLQVAADENSGERRLFAVATNGHRLHMTSVPAPEAYNLPGIIIPTKMAREIIRLAGKAGGQTVTMETSENAIAVTAGQERVTSKLIDGTFPDWRRVLPKPSEITATLDLGEMIAALECVMKIQAVNEEGVKAKSRSSRIRLAENGEFLTIATGSNGAQAEAMDAVPAEIAGEWGTRGVSAKYLHATLKSMLDRGAETVVIDAADAGSPMRVESTTDEDFLAIVMPMRI